MKLKQARDMVNLALRLVNSSLIDYGV